MSAHHHRHALAAVARRDLVGAPRREGLDRHGDEIGRHHAQRLDPLVDHRGRDVARRARLEDREHQRRHGVGREAFAETGPQEGDVPHHSTAISTWGRRGASASAASRRARPNAPDAAAPDIRAADSGASASAASGCRVASPRSASANPRRRASASAGIDQRAEQRAHRRRRPRDATDRPAASGSPARGQVRRAEQRRGEIDQRPRQAEPPANSRARSSA